MTRGDNMDNIQDKWSLPWHALQRALAKDIPVEAAAGYAATLEALKAQRAPRSVGQWLGRSRSRLEPPPL
jgi:hypothetical protein